MSQQYDNVLLGILQHEGKLEKFLDVMFGFLMRRTDFFHTRTTDSQNLGFPPGVNIQMVLKAFDKYRTIFQNYEHSRQENALPEKNQKLVSDLSKSTSEQTNIISTQTVTDKEKNTVVSHKTSSPGPSNDEENRVYQADSACYNGAVRDNYSWSQTIKDVDIRIKIPEGVKSARDLFVNIDRKKIRILLKQEGKESLYFDRILCYDVNRNEALWTLHPEENQVHLCLDKVQERWWEAAFEGEDKINTRKIDCSRPMHELDEEAQAKIHQLMYDEDCKRKGLLTSEQEKMRSLLDRAWDKRGSPFQGVDNDSSNITTEGACVHIK